MFELREFTVPAGWKVGLSVGSLRELERGDGSLSRCLRGSGRNWIRLVHGCVIFAAASVDPQCRAPVRFAGFGGHFFRRNLGGNIHSKE